MGTFKRRGVIGPRKAVLNAGTKRRRNRSAPGRAKSVFAAVRPCRRTPFFGRITMYVSFEPRRLFPLPAFQWSFRFFNVGKRPTQKQKRPCKVRFSAVRPCQAHPVFIFGATQYAYNESRRLFPLPAFQEPFRFFSVGKRPTQKQKRSCKARFSAVRSAPGAPRFL